MVSRVDKLVLTGLVLILCFSLWRIWDALELPGPIAHSRKDVDQCTLYMSTSAMEGSGKGVFAGTTFHIGDRIESSTAVVHMRLEHVRDTQLYYYIYRAETGHSTFNFGIPNICNHNRKAKSARLQKRAPQNVSIDVRTDAFDQHIGTHMVAVAPVAEGSEIYVNYGSEWFKGRGINEVTDVPSRPPSLSKLLRRGNAQCLSHVYVDDSPIPMAGRGLFSNISFSEGSTVYISPVLVLPKQNLLQHQDVNLLINYVISEDGSDAALMPIGLPGMLNHGGAKSNVRMEWHTGDGEESRLDMPIKDLQALPFAPLDIRYVATRPISRGEELLLDYGEYWSRRWIEHIDRLAEWNGPVEWSADVKEHAERPKVGVIPQFRESIRAPEGLFPAHFKSECIESDEVCAAYTSLSEKKKQRSHLYNMSKVAIQRMS